MSAIYKFFLDGTLVQDSVTWDRLNTTISRINEYDGVIRSQEAEVQFQGDGYDLLRAKFLSDTVCSETEILIQKEINGTYVDYFEGVIKNNGITFLHNEKIAKTKVQDNSFYARINNNRNVEAIISIGKSKNDDVITPAYTDNVIFLDLCSGTIQMVLIGCYRVENVFRFLLDFMTDGDVDFDSPLFGAGGDYEYLSIIKGSQLRNHNAPVDDPEAPKISFDTIYKELKKKLNIGFYFDTTGVKPKMIIDYKDNIFLSTVTETINDPVNIEETTAIEKFYSKVKVGSTQTFDFIGCPGGSFPEGQDFTTYKEETYNTLGQCNIDNVLDLVSNWIISHNTIWMIVAQASADYENEICLIDCVYSNNMVGVITNFDNNGSSFNHYNPRFLNNLVIQNFQKDIHNTIVNWVGPSNDLFYANRLPTEQVTMYKTAPGTSSGPANQPSNPLLFPNVVSDPGNNFDGTHYTATQNGTYAFHYQSGFIFYGTTIFFPFGQQMVFGVQVDLDHYNSVGTLLNTYSDVHTITHLFGGGQQTTAPNAAYINQSINMTAGDYVKMDAKYYIYSVPAGNAGYVYFGHFGHIFECYRENNGGGGLAVFDPKDLRRLRYKFEYPISQVQWDNIKLNQLGKIKAVFLGNDFTGWIEKIDYDDLTQRCKFQLLFSQNDA